jgi:hypothetical protein
MITNRETAKLLSDTLQRMRDDLREIHHSVETGCQPQEFAAYTKALSRILHHFDADILEPIYRAHSGLSAQAKIVNGRKSPLHSLTGDSAGFDSYNQVGLN